MIQDKVFIVNSLYLGICLLLLFLYLQIFFSVEFYLITKQNDHDEIGNIFKILKINLELFVFFFIFLFYDNFWERQKCF